METMERLIVLSKQDHCASRLGRRMPAPKRPPELQSGHLLQAGPLRV
jgi:hypothetical protein